MRGFTVKDVVENWFVDQHIDPAMYQAEFIPHTESQLWSSIFVVNENGIFGDLIRGGLFQLSQGYYKENTLISFSYDFSQWKISENDSEAAEYLKQLIEKLKVNDESTKQILKEKLNATFAHDYLKGYFETSDSVEFGLWFVDYNRLLGDLYNDFSTTTDSGTHAAQAKEGTLHGKAGNNGTAKGEVRIILDPLDYKGDFPEGAILVCHMTTPEYLPFMQKAGAIITEVGGILSHAVVVARELKKPCLIGVKDAAEILKDGEKIEVDANKGIVSIL
jgi:phosphohistidine swiveling domain-containing protein